MRLTFLLTGGQPGDFYMAAGFKKMALSNGWLFCLIAALTAVPAAGLGGEADISAYSDTFGSLNENLWDRAQYTNNDAQLQNFKLGNLEISSGRLRITTRPGGFSKAGLSSRYVFRGDFDIQIDCHYSFKNGRRGMDQVTGFAVSTKLEDSPTWRVAQIRLEKWADRRSPRIVFLNVKNRKAVSYQYRDTGDFHGTLRLVREGKKIRALYRAEDAERWQTLGYTSHFTGEDVFTGFVLQNFSPRRKKISAEESLEVVFDNFKINHAKEIVEDEI